MSTNEQISPLVLAALEGLTKEIADLKAALASSKPSQKASKSTKSSDSASERKPRKKSSWDDFQAKVRAALSEGGLKANAMSYASYLKGINEDYASWDTDSILAVFSDYTPPPTKPRQSKAKPKEDGKASEAKPRAKSSYKPTPEHLAKMQAARKEKAAARKAAEAASKAAEASDAESEPEASPKAPSPKAAPKASPKAAPNASPTLSPLPYKGNRLLWDKQTNGTWLNLSEKNEQPVKGDWFGVYDKAKKSVDTSVPDPDA